MLQPSRAEIAVGVFTLTYVAAFTAYFLAIGNYEFIVYVLTMLALIALVGLSLRMAEFPLAMLWALSAWGLAHMAGGGVRVDGSVLYDFRLLPLVENGDVFILKYDQLVHAYGFGISAWLLRHLLIRHYPAVERGVSGYVYPAIGAMGLGAVNEIIEFTAVLILPDTNVGGYSNTALDLVFNAIGAVSAMCLIGLARVTAALPR